MVSDQGRDARENHRTRIPPLVAFNRRRITMSTRSILLLALGVGACSSGPSDPPVLREPSGTAIIFDNKQLALRDIETGSQRLLPGPSSIVARMFDADRMVRARWLSEGVGPGLE